MIKKFTTQFYRCVVPFFLAFCLIFVGFTSPAYAASSDPFMDGLKNGAGEAVGAGLAAAALCLGSTVLAPPTAPAVCIAATETAFGWLGLKWVNGKWSFR